MRRTHKMESFIIPSIEITKHVYYNIRYNIQYHIQYFFLLFWLKNSSYIILIKKKKKNSSIELHILLLYLSIFQSIAIFPFKTKSPRVSQFRVKDTVLRAYNVWYDGGVNSFFSSFIVHEGYRAAGTD